MITVILIGIVVYLVLKMIKRDVDDFTDVKAIQKKIHKFSGVNEEMYEQYLAYINLAKENIKDVKKSKEFFYNSLRILEEIALYGVSGDLDIQDEMTFLIQELGYNFEILLMNSALNSGVRFNPRYLNEKIA